MRSQLMLDLLRMPILCAVNDFSHALKLLLIRFFHKEVSEGRLHDFDGAFRLHFFSFCNLTAEMPPSF